MKLLVVDDEPLANAIALLRGQWQAETGSELSVDTVTEEDLAAPMAGGLAETDAVIYAPRLLGTLVESKTLAPIARESLDDRQFDWADIFELLKTREVVWGGQVYAVPLGSPVLVCFYREDLLTALGLSPPRTWEEYRDVAVALAAHGTSQSARDPDTKDSSAQSTAWSATIEPLGSGWAGLTLLARAAAYARHANHYSTLFNMQTMEPLVASPPFVRALEELIAVTKLLPAEAIDYGPAQAWQALLEGRAGMALCWPVAGKTANEAGPHSPAAEAPPLDSVELPGSSEVYNATAKAWERRPGGTVSVPVIGMTGRVGSISAKSAHSAAALRLLAWLASRRWSERTVTASDATTLFRPSQVATAQAWARGMRPTEAKHYAATVATTLGALECLVAPRIPGMERYLAALDSAVRKALTGQFTPESALAQAADEWRGITAELGLDRQRDAYQRSLGLE